MTQGDALRAFRLRCGMSIEALAIASGVGAPTLVRVETGVFPLLVEDARKIAPIFNVPIHRLVLNKETRPKAARSKTRRRRVS